MPAGRVTPCAPPPANERTLIRHDGAPGMTRPAILNSQSSFRLFSVFSAVKFLLLEICIPSAANCG